MGGAIMQKQYIAIDLKSFYASVECVERGLDPMTTHLVVADASRTEKTICLAVSPALKVYGIPGRARLFEVVQRVQEVNALRAHRNRIREFAGEALESQDLQRHPDWKLGYIVAPPRMGHYMACSARLPEVRGSGGHSPLFHRRGLHRCHCLFEALWRGCQGLCKNAHAGGL